MQKADALSRNLTHKPDSFDNEDIVLIKDEWMGRAIVRSNQDSLRMKLEEFAATEERRHVPEECFRSRDIWKATIGDRDKIFIPAELRGEVIRGFHDDPMVGHPGRKKTTELV